MFRKIEGNSNADMAATYGFFVEFSTLFAGQLVRFGSTVRLVVCSVQLTRVFAKYYFIIIHLRHFSTTPRSPRRTVKCEACTTTKKEMVAMEWYWNPGDIFGNTPHHLKHAVIDKMMPWPKTTKTLIWYGFCMFLSWHWRLVMGGSLPTIWGVDAAHFTAHTHTIPVRVKATVRERHGKLLQPNISIPSTTLQKPSHESSMSKIGRLEPWWMENFLCKRFNLIIPAFRWATNSSARFYTIKSQ